MRREFEDFWKSTVRNRLVLQADRHPRVTKKVIFGTGNRVSRECSKNPKMAFPHPVDPLSQRDSEPTGGSRLSGYGSQYGMDGRKELL